MGWDGVFCCPVVQQLSIDVARRRPAWIAEVEVVVMMGVTAAPHRLDVDQRRSPSGHREFASHRS